jgi:hypothetical protein
MSDRVETSRTDDCRACLLENNPPTSGEAGKSAYHPPRVKALGTLDELTQANKTLAAGEGSGGASCGPS